MGSLEITQIGAMGWKSCLKKSWARIFFFFNHKHVQASQSPKQDAQQNKTTHDRIPRTSRLNRWKTTQETEGTHKGIKDRIGTAACETLQAEGAGPHL